MAIEKKTNRVKIFEGSTKIIYQTDEEYAIVQFFKDTLKHNGEIITVAGKGIINNNTSAFLMQKLDLIGINHHFIEKLNMREQQIQTLDIIPLQIRVTNVAVDNYVDKYGIQDGYLFDEPMIEFRIKNRAGTYPVINESQIIGFNWMYKSEIKEIKILAYRINDFLSGYFAACGLRLVECFLEFGRVYNGEDFMLMLADELTLETCRLWDIETNQKYDISSIAANQETAIDIYKQIVKKIGLK